MSDARIIELEIKLAYLEDLTQTLNEIVTNQQRQIDRLENSLKMLHENQQTLAANIHS
ncbi:MAG: SlyX family protein [Methylococcales bacterium]|nr:SlyX family protein [Methylococcales bacterium]